MRPSLRPVLVLALSVAMLSACTRAGEAPGSETVDVFTIKLGDCLSSGMDAQSVAEMDKIDCAKPHVYEVYHAFDIDRGAFPGDDVVDKLAEEGCTKAFAGFVGKSYDDSELHLQTLTPQADGWKEKNDREVLCLIVTEDESPRTGSAKGLGI